jgi:hypothetical protein
MGILLCSSGLGRLSQSSPVSTDPLLALDAKRLGDGGDLLRLLSYGM